MNIDDRLEDLERQIAELKAYRQEEQKRSEMSKALESVNRYYYICSSGEVGDTVYDPNSSYDTGRVSHGNRFFSKDQAEFFAERFRVIEEMRNCGGWFEPNWSDEHQPKYYLSSQPNPNTNERVIAVQMTFTVNNACGVYFSSLETARVCIDYVGHDRIMKYYFLEHVNEKCQ